MQELAQQSLHDVIASAQKNASAANGSLTHDSAGRSMGQEYSTGGYFSGGKIHSVTVHGEFVGQSADMQSAQLPPGNPLRVSHDHGPGSSYDFEKFDIPGANGHVLGKPQLLKPPFISAVSHTGSKSVHLYLPSPNPADHPSSRNGIKVMHITDPNLFGP
jgi:hypothetical protein